MKTLFIYIALVLVVAGTVYALRFINQATSPVTTFKPANGVLCVQVSSDDGVALSCINHD